MKRVIIDFVVKFQNYQQVKYKHQKPNYTLQRMPIIEWKWEWITMVFVVSLLKTLRKCDSIWVIIYRLIKLVHFILVRIDYNVIKLSKIYVKKIVSLHGVQVSIVLERRTQFTSNFWERL